MDLSRIFHLITFINIQLLGSPMTCPVDGLLQNLEISGDKAPGIAFALHEVLHLFGDVPGLDKLRRAASCRSVLSPTFRN